jgi:hypothetical protein
MQQWLLTADSKPIKIFKKLWSIKLAFGYSLMITWLTQVELSLGLMIKSLQFKQVLASLPTIKGSYVSFSKQEKDEP